MAEYIDRDLIKWYGCIYENASCEKRECSGCIHARCFQSQVMQIPSADVIEREKIDKVIEEIPSLSHWQSDDGQDLVMVADVIELIKRNIGE